MICPCLSIFGCFFGDSTWRIIPVSIWRSHHLHFFPPYKGPWAGTQDDPGDFHHESKFWGCSTQLFSSFHQSAIGIPSPKTNSSHLKIGWAPRGSFIFQPSIFRGELLVSGRVIVGLGAGGFGFLESHYERDCYQSIPIRDTLRIPNHRAPNQQLTSNLIQSIPRTQLICLWGGVDLSLFLWVKSCKMCVNPQGGQLPVISGVITLINGRN